MNNARHHASRFARHSLSLAVAAGLTFGVAANSHAELTGFYEGETLEILTPWAPGGGADTWGRYIAGTIGPFLGDDVSVQVVNRPGAGGVQGTNEFELRTASDGMTVMLQSAGQVFPFMYGSSAVRYDFRNYEPIVAMAQGGVVYANAELGIEEPHELWDVDQLIYGEVSPQAIGSMTLAAFALLDLPHDAIFGYESRGPARLALEQGETNLDFQTTSAYTANVEPLVEEGIAVPLFSLGIIDTDGELVRDPAFPDMPTVAEVYEERHGEAPSGVAWDAYRAVLSAGSIKMLWAKSDAPEDSINDLRYAFEQARQDEDFIADSEEANGPYEWLVGDDAYTAMSATLEISDEALDYLRATFKERYDADL
ncbi:Tripartite-type tricarboxylate transporter, receptor component TctC [Franzmannia pantelleriensis]|uniref:Tripartite-type tricarboxylate transporter, receptor component TctC n=1 Tax=Franzmannia pantelleriensis TaxID=48727 RepID=A0A1G9GPX4_9GAMM|nr:tripartite tricarboxylate transporter substrate-binding protein [Halomonas pantelleriensis]SDL02740.1 Tripartite-type tricarboxylate transporter, receptor component TctC [Halomonas pantelleriensis]